MILEKNSRPPRKFEGQLVTGEQRERNGLGQFQPLPEERRQEVLNTAVERIRKGDHLDDIAQDLQIGTTTLDIWLASLGDEYKDIRRTWVNAKLAKTEEMMRDAPNPLELARGRDLGKRAEWLAARIFPEQYVEKREITVKADEPQTEDQVRDKIKQLEAKLNIKTIEAERSNVLIAPAQLASPS